MPTLTEVMTAFPVHVDEKDSIAACAEVMKEHHCHHLPVLRGHEPVGVLSTREIELARQPGTRTADLVDLTAGDLCRQFDSVDLHTRLDVVLDNMADQGEDAVLVMRQGRMAGILTSQDVCRSYAAWLKDHYLPTDDPEIA
ncbi:CBS domain-containing protein [Bacterioplanes sanyensis]|uniref:CBS domain-containing protein n=2 Tax=Bacterioplanes sanyensis TaxID=1249553 RepID=A0A222FR62_9GAMM|nr:CBS domain-containing protein [Bacterioplanes sanyensis]